MADWTTQRDGNYKRISSNADSPWHDGGSQTAESRYPDIGPGTGLGGGTRVFVRHSLTIDGTAACGHAPPATPRIPPRFAASGGSAATDLPTGDYRASYIIRALNGQTSAGVSETDPVPIVFRESKPRVIFPTYPPAGGTYVLMLTEAGGAAGTGRRYCYDIPGMICDLASPLWGNEYTYGVAAEKPTSTPFAAASAPPAVRDTAALVIESTGSLIFADGSLLTIGGDFLIESPDGSTATWATFRGAGTYQFSAAKAQDPTTTTYRVVWGGHGRFAWTA